jgi:hypothetical protein
MPKSLSPFALGARVLAMLFLFAGSAAADTLPKPAGSVMLEVTGAIANHNDGDKAAFDLAMLEGMGVTRIVTSTAWTEGTPAFEGVLLSKLIERVGATGKVAVTIALNDYKVEIPVSDFAKYPVILAYRMNGELLKIRDKGPLWIVYPQDGYPELKTKETQAKWVWQVKEIRFK